MLDLLEAWVIASARISRRAGLRGLGAGLVLGSLAGLVGLVLGLFVTWTFRLPCVELSAGIAAATLAPAGLVWGFSSSDQRILSRLLPRSLVSAGLHLGAGAGLVLALETLRRGGFYLAVLIALASFALWTLAWLLVVAAAAAPTLRAAWGRAVSDAREAPLLAAMAGGISLVPTAVTIPSLLDPGPDDRVVSRGFVSAEAAGLEPAWFSATAVAVSESASLGPPVDRPQGTRASSLAKVSGDEQVGVCGAYLPLPLVVRVDDADGPARGVPVQFEPRGVTLWETWVETDARGVASVKVGLGSVPGTGVVTARAGDESVRFTVTTLLDPPPTLSIVAGDGQRAPIGTVLGALVVSVRDPRGAPVSWRVVDFAVTAGTATLTSTSAFTGKDGTACVGLTLGDRAGAVEVTATSGQLLGAPLHFVETALRGPPARVVKLSGDDQVGGAGSALPGPLVVSVVDRGGNALAGVPVRFASRWARLRDAEATTDEEGRASTLITLPPEGFRGWRTVGGLAVTWVLAALGSVAARAVRIEACRRPPRA